MFEKIQELKEVLAIFGVLIIGLGTLGTMYLNWQIDSAVTDAINNQNAITPEQLAVVTTKLTAIKEDVQKLEGNDSRLEGKIDQVITILLED